MILLYHLIFTDSTPEGKWNAGMVLRLRDFKKQIKWLKKHFRVLSLNDYLSSTDPKKAALTFDDGYQDTFDLIFPFLEKEQIPATFFSTTSHLDDGNLLWFTYFNALCSENQYQEIKIGGKCFPLSNNQSRHIAWKNLIELARKSGNPIGFSHEFAQQYPLSEEICSHYQGMTTDQFKFIGTNPLFEAGGHTHNHPYLDQLSKEDQLTQILINKDRLEEITQSEVRYFAYPGGIYNLESIQVTKSAGFNAGFSVRPLNLSPDNLFEIARVDIYSPSVFKFIFKAIGLVNFVDRIGLRRR